MSERERWIVYPLLFLILGIALRDKFGTAKELRAQRVICEKLVVLNKDAEPQVVLDSTEAGGVIRAISADHTMQLVLGHETHASSLFRETATADGIATRALLGDLRGGAPRQLLQWLGNLPLFDTFNPIAQPPADAPAPAN
jgi:hypothetical protein